MQKRKQHLNKHLSAYAASAACFLLIKQEADAQVVYVDIDPDSILDEKYDFAELDLDNNGTADFFFLNSSFTFYTLTFYTYRLRQDIAVGPAISENAMAGISNYFNVGYTAYTNYYPYALPSGSVINDGLQWQNHFVQIMALRTFNEAGDLIDIANYGWFNPDVSEVLDHYLGVRFIDDAGQNHYGWIRCDVKDEGRTLVIKDYAYELQPDHPIVAGSTEHYVDISETQIDKGIVIYSYDKTVFIQVKDFSNAEISIADMSGKVLIKKMLYAKNEQIEMTAYPSGIYFATVKSADKMFSKKVILN
ncbi:MAG TPA: T9SS type A sorting domain-containing protein [Chitinophagales bacterium]|nr:T9SS type A sorting domain-containing protein [Chitinophagales bacterium]